MVKNTFAERNKTFCDKTLNKCIANAYFFVFVTLIINIESVEIICFIYEQLLTGQTQQYMQLFTLCFLYLRI